MVLCKLHLMNSMMQRFDVIQIPGQTRRRPSCVTMAEVELVRDVCYLCDGRGSALTAKRCALQGPLDSLPDNIDQASKKDLVLLLHKAKEILALRDSTIAAQASQITLSEQLVQRMESMAEQQIELAQSRINVICSQFETKWVAAHMGMLKCHRLAQSLEPKIHRIICDRAASAPIRQPSIFVESFKRDVDQLVEATQEYMADVEGIDASAVVPVSEDASEASDGGSMSQEF